MLKNLVNELTGAPKQTTGNGRKNSNNRRQKSKSKGYKTSTKGFKRNPRKRNSPDNTLSLTRSQFTATSPQNYWEFIPASSPGGLRVRARELVTALNVGSTSLNGAFSNLYFGNSSSTNRYWLLTPSNFPRLQQIANAFEMYIFHKADILFQSNTATTVNGAIAVAADYDNKDTLPTNMQDIMRNISSSMANIYSDCSFQMLKSLSRLPKYFCTEPVAGDGNQLNQGVLYAAVDGLTAAAGTGLGYIIVEYDVEFFTPQ